MHRFALDNRGERHRLIDAQTLTAESVGEIACQMRIKISNEHFDQFIRAGDARQDVRIRI